jgi:hypothetical protein
MIEIFTESDDDRVGKENRRCQHCRLTCPVLIRFGWSDGYVTLCEECCIVMASIANAALGQSADPNAGTKSS